MLLNRKYNVLHVVGGYPSNSNPNIGVFIKAQIDSLIDLGLDCNVFILNGKGFLKYFLGIFRLRKHLKNNVYDLIHGHYMYCGWVARLAILGKPVIVSFMGTDVYGNVKNDGRLKYFSHFLHKNFSKLLCHFVTGVIVKSFKIKQLLGFNKCEIIPNGVDTRIFNPNNKIEKEKLGLNNKIKYILFAGSVERAEKRFYLAQKAVDLLKKDYCDVELLVIRGKKQSEFVYYLNAVDVLLITSTHEGSPNVIKEALACNLPIVSVDVGDAKERLNGVDNCFIVDTNENSIASKLKEILTTNRRSNNGIEHIEKLNLENINNRIIDFYFKVITL